MGRELVPGVAKIVEMKARHADQLDRVRPGGHLVEVATPQRAALDAGEDERARLVIHVHRQMIAKRRDDGVGDADDASTGFGFGRPMSISPVDRSTAAARTLTVRASRSRSQRRSAVASPQRRQAQVASSTRA